MFLNTDTKVHVLVQFNSSKKSIFIIYCQSLIIVVLHYIIATMLLTLTNLEGEESFDATMLGHAEEIVQERISDDELVIIKESV